MIRFAQKWHKSSGFERIYTWWGYDGHLVAICFQCFHQAANMHGLGTAAHGAMVVDELQGMRPRNKTEKPAVTAACHAKHSMINCVLAAGRILL
jgi:hypothetical protein